jgi:hypothetical protein
MIVELPTRHGLWVQNATKIQMKDYSHIMSFTARSNQNLQLKSQKEISISCLTSYHSSPQRLLLMGN